MAAAAMRQPCGGPLGVFAVVEKHDGYRPEVRYVFKDHLGSWTTVAAAWQHYENAYGQITAYTTGNGALSTVDYNDRHLPERQTTVASRNILQDLSYEYDDFGNLAARKDNIKNLKERFTYDNLNRLESVALNGATSDRIKYDPYGRIVNKQADNFKKLNDQI